MMNGFDDMILNMTDTMPEPEDYTGGQSGKSGKPPRSSAPTLKLSSI